MLESLLAVALTLRGVRAHFLLCDEALPACQQADSHILLPEAFSQDGMASTCRMCYTPGNASYQALGLPILRYSQFMTSADRQRARQLASAIPQTEIGDFRLDGIAIGEHARAGALRYFASGDLEGEPLSEAILRRYFEASLLTTYAVHRLLRTRRFTRACFNHGIYVPQGLVGEVARQANVPVVNWNPAYRKHCFIFSHHDTYRHTLLTEPASHWEQLPWSSTLEAQTLDYLKSRWQGTQDWIWFHEKPQEELPAIARELGIDLTRPCIGMLSNVMWDAQLHYRANAFPRMLDWVLTTSGITRVRMSEDVERMLDLAGCNVELHTIRYFANRPELQLILRIHPAEVRGTLPSRQPLQAEIRRVFPTLPPNVFVIPPESPISTYAVMTRCNAVIIYGTKTGVELTSLGIPVIVAGEAWIRNKGITWDAETPEQYTGFLNRLPLAEPMSDAMTRRARRYAYHFFFRRMIPLTMMEPASGWPPYRIQLSSLEELMPGRDPGLDVICNGILIGAEFIYPAEAISRSSQLQPSS